MFSKARFHGRLGATRRWAEAYRGAYGGRRTSRRSARLRGVPRRLRGAWAASRRTRRRLGGSARARDSVFAGGSAHARERATARERKRLRGKEKSRALVPIERIRERQRHREREEHRRRRSSLLSAAGLHLSCRPPPVAPASPVSRRGSLQGRVEASPELFLEPTRGGSH